MQLTKDLSQNYTTILKEELVAAMGCTEPIAIAYAAPEGNRDGSRAWRRRRKRGQNA